MSALRKVWQIPANIRVLTYEWLGRVQAADELARYRPDLVVLDEAHRIKNPRAAVTRRVMRYLDSNRECVLVAMSGTMTRKSIRDYSHLLFRCLGPENAPLPRPYHELQEWADALDEIGSGNAVEPGALLEFCTPEDRENVDAVTAARRGFRRRLVETPGVVATEENPLACSLSINAIRLPSRPAVSQALQKLRDKWELPNGVPLADGMAVWRQTRELSLGFFYEWRPGAPKDWLNRRRDWCSACRHILTTNRRHLDSELQVANAVDGGQYPEAAEALKDWREIKNTFKPNPVPVWIDEGAVEAIKAWSQVPGIVWVEHRALGQKLSLGGLRYFGAKGRDKDGLPVELAPTDRAIVASVASNSEGRNLQAWNRNLITSVPPSGSAWEQVLGRTHREGQQADEVSVDVLIGCREHSAAFLQAQKDAAYIQDSTGQPQKILYADIQMPIEGEGD